MARSDEEFKLGEQVLSLSVFRSGEGFRARLEASWAADGKDRTVWVPSDVQSRTASTPHAAALAALDHVKKVGEHRGQGPKPIGHGVARRLMSKPYRPSN